MDKIVVVLTLLFTLRVPVFGFDEFLRKQSPVYGIASLANISSANSACYQDLKTFFNAANLGHVWALKAMDASGQPQQVFLWGNNFWLGSRSECWEIFNKKPLEINHEKIKHASPTDYDSPPVKLDFAMSYILHNNTLQQHLQLPLENMIQLGLCVPSSCSTQDIQELLQEYFHHRYLGFQNHHKLDLDIVQVKFLNDQSWMASPEFIILCIILATTLALTVLGTIYDSVYVQPKKKPKKSVFKQNLQIFVVDSSDKLNKYSEVKSEDLKDKKQGTMGKIIQCFSLYSNMKSVMNTKVSSETIGPAHGFRFLSMTWVVIVHSIYFESDFIENRPYVFRFSETFNYQSLTNSTYCVDSFLFLSGFLLSYSYFKHQKKLGDRKLSLVKKLSQFVGMFFYRYLRLTPIYCVALVLASVVFKYQRETSVFYISEQADELCSKYWWRNLLYINNLFKRDEMCLSWSWYLSADTQFFVISTLLIIFSTVAFKTTVTVLFMVLMASMSITGYQSYSVGYIPTLDEQRAQLDTLYDLPWNRIGPHLIGVITGYILIVKLNEKLELKKRFITLLWILSFALNLWIIFALYGRQNSVLFSAVYMGVSRTLWSVGLAWLFIACCTNNGGIINEILSFRGWIPLGRVSYATYLIHPLLVYTLCATSESSQNASPSSFMMIIFGTGLIAFLSAIWFSVLFESPYILLTKMMFTKTKKPSRSIENGDAT